MFFLARSALCIGIVATMLPDTGQGNLRDVAAGMSRAASSQVHTLFHRAEATSRRSPDLIGRIDVGRLAAALESRDGPRMDQFKNSRDRGVSASPLAMLDRATAR